MTAGAVQDSRYWLTAKGYAALQTSANPTPVRNTPVTAAPTNTSPAPHIVVASEGTRLEQLHAQFADAKSAAKEADDRLKAITDGIKAELAAAEPGQGKVELRSPVGPPLRMTYVESWRMDTKRLKAERPDVYVSYAVQGGSWQLRAVTGTDAD